MSPIILIRPVAPADHDGLWSILEPILRAGETYAPPRDWGRAETLAYWLGAEHEVFVATDGIDVAGTYFVQANQRGGGGHVANCGFAVASGRGGRGVGAAMCEHALEHAAARGFKAMQFKYRDL